MNVLTMQAGLLTIGLFPVGVCFDDGNTGIFKTSQVAWDFAFCLPHLAHRL